MLVWVNQLGTWGTTTRLQVPEAALSASRDQMAEKGLQNQHPPGEASQGQKPAVQQQRRAQPTTREGQPSTPCAHPGGRETRQQLALQGGKAPAAAGGGSLPVGALSPGAGLLPA